MRTIANSKSRLLDPDKNPVIRSVVKPFVYDQFCAGTNKTEIQRTITDIKKLGFAGVILCYGRELQVDKNKGLLGHVDVADAQRNKEIEEWRDGTVETLGMVGKGDWLGIK